MPDFFSILSLRVVFFRACARQRFAATAQEHSGLADHACHGAIPQPGIPNTPPSAAPRAGLRVPFERRINPRRQNRVERIKWRKSPLKTRQNRRKRSGFSAYSPHCGVNTARDARTNVLKYPRAPRQSFREFLRVRDQAPPETHTSILEEPRQELWEIFTASCTSSARDARTNVLKYPRVSRQSFRAFLHAKSNRII